MKPESFHIGGAPGVAIVEGDVLAVDLPHVVAEPSFHVVGNLPYNVASQILLRLVGLGRHCRLAVVTLQEEVAQRVVAGPGSRRYGVLSLLVQLYAEPEWCFRISRHCFSPPPQVESATVRLRVHPEPRVSVPDPGLFRHLVRMLFQQRRKMVRATLGEALEAVGVEAEQTTAVLDEAGIDERSRPEAVSLAGFARLTSAVAARRREDD